MQKLIKLLQGKLFVIVVIVISIFSFFRMLRPGIYSMQDFHLFRLFQFDKCVKVLEIPCRWAPDAGMGYGEPVFNFYGQLSYVFGEVFYLSGFSLIDSLKIVFIISLVGSFSSMYFLAKRIWGSNLSGFLSATLYLYAPYRAIDVWVRGALPESLSFVFFPLIILFVDKFIEKRKLRDLLLFSFFTALLIINHNLSFVMFLPFLVGWILFKLMVYKSFKTTLKVGFGFVGSLLLSSFYILPVIFESKYVDLISTTIGYFDFRGHFATINQLLFSNFWGYGGSVFGPEDGLSLSVGYMQWIVPLIALGLILVKKSIKSYKNFLLILLIGWFYLLMTHNKSTFIWESIPGMAYIQFPWRFVGMATFCFSLSSGLLISLFSQRYKIILSLILIVLSIGINTQFFRGDIWYPVSDSYFTTGEEWDRQRSASIRDFWPKFGHEIPNKISDGTYINYFPGWVSSSPSEKGLILSEGARFTNTPVRTIGNTISLISLFIFGYLFIVEKKWKEKA